jgi:uncharacterized small protein (DUF1192 family)
MQKPQPKCLKLSEIRLDHRLQSRVEINQDVVAEYRDAILAGEKLPPVAVVFDKVYYYLVDGFHRFDATTAANLGEINALVTEGHFQDALLASVGANSKHGLRRTNDDKRRAVQTILSIPAWAEWSDNQIAKACGVSHPFVAAIRYPEAAKRQQENRDRSADKKRAGVESDSTGRDEGSTTEPVIGLQKAPTIREQKAGAPHEGAAELASRTDAVATKPPLRQRADEDSSPANPSPLEIVTGERDELREQLNDVATTARELEAEVEAYRAGDRGEGEKQLVEANQRIAKLEGEIRRLEAIRDDWMNKHAEALKQIKRLQRQLERGHA